MRSALFSQVAELGMFAYVVRPWHPPLRGRVVALTKPRYGLWVRNENNGEVIYTDSVWVHELWRDGKLIAKGNDL